MPPDLRLGKVPLSGGLIDTGDQDVGANGRGNSDEGQPGKGRVGIHLCLFLLLDLAVLVGPGGLRIGLEERSVGLELSSGADKIQMSTDRGETKLSQLTWK